MDNGNVFKNISYPLAERIIESTNNTTRGKPFFDNSEVSMLSMLIFYCDKMENKKTISEILYGVNTLLDNINSITDFHELFMDMKDELLLPIYEKSSFNAIYKEYNTRFFYSRGTGMTQEDAEKENNWILNSFNITLDILKNRFERNDIDLLIEIQQAQSTAISIAVNIVNGELDLNKLEKAELLTCSIILFDKSLQNEFSGDKIISLAQDRLNRELSKR